MGGRSCEDLDLVIGLGICPFVKPEARVSIDFLGLCVLSLKCINGLLGKGGRLSSVAYERSPKLLFPDDDW